MTKIVLSVNLMIVLQIFYRKSEKDKGFIIKNTKKKKGLTVNDIEKKEIVKSVKK